MTTKGCQPESATTLSSSEYAFPLSPEVERAIVTVDGGGLARDG